MVAPTSFNNASSSEVRCVNDLAYCVSCSKSCAINETPCYFIYRDKGLDLSSFTKHRVYCKRSV